MAMEQQQHQAQGDCELLGQSMLRMIRSARHRLQREGSRGPGSARGSFVNEVAYPAAGLPGHRGRSASKPEPMLFPRGSENAGPAPGEKPHPNRSERPAVLGEITNLANHRPPLSQRPPLGDANGAKHAAVEPSANAALVAAVPRPRAPPSATPPPLPLHKDVDVDKANAEDPQHVSEYAADIYFNLQQLEGQYLVDAAYMERQPQVTARMRMILVDWLVDVHRKYKLRQQTLFIAIGILDKFLEKRSTLRRHLQLVGIAALLIASKFEELYPPQINDFVYVTDKAYTREEVMRMEVSILTVLEFKVCLPTSMHFLERYQAVNGCADAHRELAQYLLELTLPDYRMLSFPASHVAASALLLSNRLLRRQPVWSPAVVKHTKLTEPMLRDCTRDMYSLLEHAENAPLQAVRKKYSQAKHHAVAKMGFAGMPPSLPPPPPPGQSPSRVPSQAATGEEAAGAGAAALRGTPSSSGQASSDCGVEALGSFSPVETVSV